MRLLTRLLAVLAVAALAAISAAGGDMREKVGCSAAGTHYRGTTSQKRPLCFTISRDGRKLVEYAYGLHDNCGDGGTRVKPKHGYVTTLQRGRFKFGNSLVFFKGVVRGATASGTLRNYSLDQNFNTCDTGVRQWTAHRR